MSRRTRILTMVGVGLIVWFAFVTLRWAMQPLDDTQSVGLNADKTIAYQKVECGSLFDASPTGGKVIPAPVTPATVTAAKLGEWGFGRPPCELGHQQGRALYAIDAATFVVGLGALAFVAKRTRPRDGAVSALPALA
ncbi:MAG: hypothetical protein WCC60_10660 [Ilumatobacteraceae bacterium]